MNNHIRMIAAALALVLTAVSDQALAISITHGDTTVNMDFVAIGNPGNPADTSGYGSVDYLYEIGTKEVSINQFMTAYSADNRISDGNEGEPWLTSVGGNAPATWVNAYETMKYANWLTTGDAYIGAYQFNSSGGLTNVNRSAAVTAYGTVYVVPSENEWYKAAYYRPVNDGSYSLYSNGSDDPNDLIQGAPDGWNYYDGDFVIPGGEPWEIGSGAQEQNGTFDMMGNVWEQLESPFDGTLDSMSENRVIRGGAYGTNGVPSQDSSNRNSVSPTHIHHAKGFRVAMIPEPSSVALIGLGGCCAVFIRRLFFS